MQLAGSQLIVWIKHHSLTKLAVFLFTWITVVETIKQQNRATYSCTAAGQIRKRELGLQPRQNAMTYRVADAAYAACNAIYKWTLPFTFTFYSIKLASWCSQTLFMHITANSQHVLCSFLDDRVQTVYSLRPKVHAKNSPKDCPILIIIQRRLLTRTRILSAFLIIITACVLHGSLQLKHK